jgi:thiamine biosynthesis protein ThiI
MDKVEIERIARSIDTFETSTKLASGCSAVPPYPETCASLEKVIEAGSKFDMRPLIESALTKSKVISVGG